jgi:hypothetical protein
MMLSKNSTFIAAVFAALIGSGTALIGECQIDCEVDADCVVGLKCADDHSAELRNNGYDPKKAYCDPATTGYAKADVCYDPAKTISRGPGAPIEVRGNMQLCESDCDFDSNCAEGLLCADEHGPELVAKGFHPRLANCNSNTLAIYEVCFPASLITTPGGGGGGKFYLRPCRIIKRSMYKVDGIYNSLSHCCVIQNAHM